MTVPVAHDKLVEYAHVGSDDVVEEVTAVAEGAVAVTEKEAKDQGLTPEQK